MTDIPYVTSLILRDINDLCDRPVSVVVANAIRSAAEELECYESFPGCIDINVVYAGDLFALANELETLHE